LPPTQEIVIANFFKHTLNSQSSKGLIIILLNSGRLGAITIDWDGRRY
jgi:hypothetical protein